MPTLQNYLKERFAEEIPGWLRNHRRGEKINAGEVLNSRLLYYPGSEFDGQPVHTFAQAHTVHVFVYVDYMLTRERIMQELTERGFKGYRVYDTVNIAENDLTPHGWRPHAHPSREDIERMKHFAEVQPGDGYAFLAVMEREEGLDDEHGPARFAMLYIGGDGIATYDALFCNRNAAAPFCLLLQDHGFGGNWNGFGRNSLMEQAAASAGVYPQYILASTVDSTEIWDGYVKVGDAPSTVGGMHRNRRELFVRIC